jgi:hypothetical protein
VQSVSREVLLGQLEAVSPGLSIKAEFEQSHCFVFKDHKIFTFNDEIRCEYGSCLNGIEGAVHAKPLISMLQKMTEDEIKVWIKNDKFYIKGKKRRSAIACYSDIVLEYDQAGTPKKWHPLDPDFLEGLSMVAECASDDQSAYMFTCVRITPEHVEAMDAWQAGRFKVASPVKEPIYIRKGAVRHIVDFGMEEISVGSRWVHFRSSEGLLLSCRVSRDEDYPDLDPILAVKGKRAKLPTGLVDATERAKIMCEDEDEYVVITVEPGNLRVSSSCSEGWYLEDRKVAYKGPPIQFQMSAALLIKVCEKYNEVRISADKMGIKIGGFQYITALKVADEVEDAVVEEGDDDAV